MSSWKVENVGLRPSHCNPTVAETGTRFHDWRADTPFTISKHQLVTRGDVVTSTRSNWTLALED